MLTNALVIGFLIAMVYWWGMVQGFFSAAIHLLLTIIASALAIALWEPIVLGMLIDSFPGIAWGLGLLLPFAVILLILRVTADKLVKGNVEFSRSTNIIGGSICGLLAGVVSAGLTLIGVGFMSMDIEIGGYQPFVVNPEGVVERNRGGGLLLPVERQTNALFALLSTGSFSPRHPLAEYQPDLATQAALYRMRNDRHTSIVASPQSVSIANHYALELPIHGMTDAILAKLGPEAIEPGRKIVVVETQWRVAGATYDTDSKLRVPSTQIRLIGRNRVGRPRPTLYAPVGFSKTDPATKLRRFTAFDNDTTIAYGLNQKEVLIFTFILPEEQDADYILLRHLRLELPEPNDEAPSLIAAIGRTGESATAIASTAGTPDEHVGPREGSPVGIAADKIRITDRLPRAISRNLATGLTFLKEAVLSGKADVKQSKSQIGKKVRVDRIYAASDQACVRLQLTRDKAQSLLGTARASAAMLERVWLEDDRHQSWDPIGYVWYHASGLQQVAVDRTNPIRSMKQLPVSEMGAGDSLFLYFIIPRDDLTIVACQFGSATRQELNLKIAK